MEMLSQKQKLFVIVGAILALVIIIFYYFIQMGGDEEQNEIDMSVENVKSDETSEEKIIVHITGAVNNEGIAEVNEGARLNDVIAAAGGLREDADLNNVNLAYAVEDGQKIYIPSKEDAKMNEYNEEDLVTTDAGKGVIKDNDSSDGSGSLININSANRDRLTEIPGVGEATAEKIIMYREENGKFKNIEDIKNVSGIGDKKFEAIKSYICV